MLDTCEITRQLGEPVFNPDTGRYDTPPPVGVYAGMCRVKPAYAASETQAGEQEIVLRRYTIVLPYGGDPIAVDDTVTVTTSDDAWLVGRPLIVSAVELATAATARRITARDQEG